MTETAKKWAIWIVPAAAAMLMITMGARQTLGLFIAPIDLSTGLGVVTISFAMAVAQFVWGAAQPIAGAVADRYGPVRVLVAGFVVLAAGTVLTTFATTGASLTFTIGVLAAAGAGATSLSVLMGASARLLPPEKHGMASGIINAGGSLGQFVFAPVLQAIISAAGWVSAMWFMAIMALAATPLAFLLRQPSAAPAVTAAPDAGLRAAIKTAFGDGNYILLHAGFFTCGFHIAFLVTHLPGEIALCGLSPAVASTALAVIGLANVAGSLAAGWSVNRFLSKHILFAMYASRAVLILLYLAAPKTALTFYIFAAGLGFTWLSTVSPTAAIVGKLFGARYLATLFGLTLLSHQIGGFFGAWFGGLAVARLGLYDVVWYADAVLALAAALVNLPIREPRALRPV